jgi:AcrR family transcriptional regulator
MPGLRERKKAKTRWAIQEHALRLFAEQGYEATTVDQIAAAAEISPSTFFRYFPTKEDVVVQDEYDDMFIEAFRQAGADPDPLTVLRSVLSAAVLDLDDAEWSKSMERARLVLAVPALRARSVDNFLMLAQKAGRVFADSAGVQPSDPMVVAFTGVCVGILGATAMLSTPAETLRTYGQRVDIAFGLLEGVDWRGAGR